MQTFPFFQTKHRTAAQDKIQQVQAHHQFGKAGAQCSTCRAQSRTGKRQRAEPDGAGREDKQGVEHNIQRTHDHHTDAGRAHIACGLQLAGRHIIQLEGGQEQTVHQKIGGGILPDAPIRPQYSGQR